jgi:non-heme chloroperoxidase
MAEFTTRDGTQIFFKDWGTGQPIVFSHGWPLSSDDWDAQMLFFLHHGYRVIAHDRRGHGRSAQVSEGNDMDHGADQRRNPVGPANRSQSSRRAPGSL